MTLIIILLGASLIPWRTAKNNGLLESRKRWGRRGCNFHAWLWRKRKRKRKERQKEGGKFSAHAAAAPLVRKWESRSMAVIWEQKERWALSQRESFAILINAVLSRERGEHSNEKQL